jgi:disulfide bond formation protein DsbB
MQGFIYIFFSYQTWFGRVFWILVIILMTILGLYWCIKAYIDWQDKPVLTTITTTAFPVKAVRETKQACETDTSYEGLCFT